MTIKRFREQNDVGKAGYENSDIANKFCRLLKKLVSDLALRHDIDKESKKLCQDLANMDSGISGLAGIKEPGFFDDLCKNIFANVNAYSSWERCERYTNKGREEVHHLINTFLETSRELLGAHGYVAMAAERSKNEELISKVLNLNYQFTTRFVPAESEEEDNDMELQEIEEFFFDTFSEAKLNGKLPLLAFQKQCRDVSRAVTKSETQTFLLNYKPPDDGGYVVKGLSARKALYVDYSDKLKKLLKTDETVQEAHFSGNKRNDTGLQLAKLTDAIMLEVARTCV